MVLVFSCPDCSRFASEIHVSSVIVITKSCPHSKFLAFYVITKLKFRLCGCDVVYSITVPFQNGVRALLLCFYQSCIQKLMALSILAAGEQNNSFCGVLYKSVSSVNIPVQNVFKLKKLRLSDVRTKLDSWVASEKCVKIQLYCDVCLI